MSAPQHPTAHPPEARFVVDDHKAFHRQDHKSVAKKVHWPQQKLSSPQICFSQTGLGQQGAFSSTHGLLSFFLFYLNNGLPSFVMADSNPLRHTLHLPFVFLIPSVTSFPNPQTQESAPRSPISLGPFSPDLRDRPLGPPWSRISHLFFRGHAKQPTFHTGQGGCQISGC